MTARTRNIHITSEYITLGQLLKFGTNRQFKNGHFHIYNNKYITGANYDARAFITRALKQYPERSRFIIRVPWAHSSYKDENGKTHNKEHVFIAENINRKIAFINPQDPTRPVQML